VGLSVNERLYQANQVWVTDVQDRPTVTTLVRLGYYMRQDNWAGIETWGGDVLDVDTGEWTSMIVCTRDFQRGPLTDMEVLAWAAR
jgi:hypothetical protein